MKLPILILAGSLVANAALVAVYLNHASAPSASSALTPGATHAQPGASATAGTPSTVTPGAAGSATAATTVDPKTWASLNPGDLRGLVARLRAAGFSPEIIRAIVFAQVSAQLSGNARDALASLELKPFWATNTGFGYDPKAMAAYRDLNRERVRLVREALGPDFPETPEIAEYRRRNFGEISADKEDRVQRTSDDYNDLRQQTTSAVRGLMLPEDREKLALLDKEKRADLAKLLSPQELEDYLARTSQTTMQLRSSLTLMDANESEFRAIYQAKQAYEDKYGYQATGGFIGPDLMKEREAAQLKTAEQPKAALGEARYAEYTRVSDREYQSITRLADQAGLPATAAIQAYDQRTAAVKESNRVFDDPALNVDQKRAALQALAQTTRAQLTATLGADAGASYLKLADRWLTSIEKGAAVSFSDGGGTRTRNLPRTAPATRTGP